MKYLHVYKNSLLALLFIVLLASSCKKKEEQQNTIYEVKIGEALKENSTVLLSEFVDGEVEYIALESGKEHLLGQNPKFHLRETEIIAFTRKQIYIFDRNTGKFLREIGHYGKDPEGYKKVVTSFPYEENKNLFYTSGWDPKSYYSYNSDGEFCEKITAYSMDIETDMQKSIFGEMVTSIAPLNDTCFVGYVWNMNGKQKTKLIIFNENNHRLKTYAQTQSFEYDINKNGINVFSWEGWFYKFNKHLHFFERFSDTIYTVSTTALSPKFVLKQLDSETPYTKRYLPDYDANKYFFIENVFESDKYLFFQIKYQKEILYGFYNKKNGSTKVSVDVEGITNDINNFIPYKFYSSNNKGELTGSIDAYEVKLWFDKNREKAAKLPPKLQKLKNINENDNPVVMIAKLKE